MLKRLANRKYSMVTSLLTRMAIGTACKSPRSGLNAPDRPALDLKVSVEDHSRNLKRLRALQPMESNDASARAAALESHRAWLETEFRAEASDRGLIVDPGAKLRLEPVIPSLGAVRAKYIVYGIAGGVTWGVGTDLVAHDPRLAIGLGLYELLEESAFWIAGSAFFGAYSAPAVVEAAVFDCPNPKAAWTSSYHVLNGRKRLRELPKDRRSDRATQLYRSLRVALDKLFMDLEALPGFPRRTGAPRSFAPSAPSPQLAPALP
jgi:hypothetical protein